MYVASEKLCPEEIGPIQRTQAKRPLADWNLFLPQALRQLQLLREEHLDIPSLLERSEFGAYQACKHAGQQHEAQEWLRKVHLHCQQWSGEDSPGAQEYKKMLASGTDHL